MKKILSTSLHPGSSNSLIPVIRELRRKGDRDVVLIGHLYSQKTFKEASIAFKTIGDYGFSSLSCNCVERIIGVEKPDLVLTGTSNQNDTDKMVIEQQMNLAAGRMNVKSLSILDYWGCYTDKFSDVFTKERFKYLPDKIAIMDNMAKEEMLGEGFPLERLIVTGNPYFDTLMKEKNDFSDQDNKRVRRDLGVEDGNRLIVFATQPISLYYGNFAGYSRESVTKDLFRGLETSGLKKYKLLVKVHPRDDRDLYENIAEGYSIPMIIDKEYPTTDVILASDLVISIFSTVLIEAAFFGKQGISLQPGLSRSGLSDFLITNKLGLTFPVYEYGKVGDVVAKMLSGRLSISNKCDLGVDGRATDRIISVIDVLMGSNDRTIRGDLVN